VAGIYGPGKLPLARLRRGEPTVRESEAPYTNRIHIDDLVRVCLAALARGGDGEVYNVSDGVPGNMTDYFNQVADWAGLPRPPQIPLAEATDRLSAGMLSYLQESRRLDSGKLRRELGVALRYPDLASGLAACR
jgi:nucleoside-diphosphate-sugar epimerase